MTTRCGIKSLLAVLVVVLSGGCRRGPHPEPSAVAPGRPKAPAAAYRSARASEVPESPDPERVVAVGGGTALRALLPTIAAVGRETPEFDRLQVVKPPRWDGSPRVSHGPWDFCVDRRGAVYIPGRHGEAVYCFGPDGRFMRKLPSRAAAHGPAEWPAAVDVDDQVRVYFWTWANDRDSEILTYEPTGHLLGTFPVQGPPGRLRVTPDGLVFGADEQPLQFVDGQLRRAPSRRLADDLRTGPMVVGLDGYVYLLLTGGGSQYGFFRYTYDMRPAGVLDVQPPPPEPGMNPLEYTAGGDAAGFLYREPLLLDAVARRATVVRPPVVAKDDGLLPAGAGICNPARELVADFYVWEWCWGEARVGHDGNWYVLTYNALEWGPWTGLRVYRYGMSRLRADAYRWTDRPSG